MAKPPGPMERLVSSVSLHLNDHYERALYSGAIAYKTNAHNLCTANKRYLGRQPIDFGSLLVTSTFYIDPDDKTCTHGEIHVNMSVDFGNGPFSIEEKIRGSEEDITLWDNELRAGVSSWFVKKEGFVNVTLKWIDIRERHIVLGETKAGF